MLDPFEEKKSPSSEERWHADLSGFLALLHSSGFTIGVDTHIQIHALLQRLPLPEHLSVLAHYLTPLLAQTQEQQAFLHQQVPLWFYVETLQNAQPESTKAVESRPQKPMKDDKPREEEPPPSTALPASRDRLVLHLASGSYGGKGLSFAVPHIPVEYARPVLRHLRQMRFMTETSRRTLDLQATLRAFSRRGSIDAPVYRYHRRHVEYLMLVEQNIHRDHRAAMVRELYHTLRQNNVDVLLYTYHTDPRLLQPMRGGRETQLRQVASTHTDAILLYFGSNDHWMSPQTLEPYRWTDTFRHWAQRYWFPINPPDRWGLAEQAGAQLFPHILPLSTDGLEQLTRHLASGDNDPMLRFDFWPEHLDYNLTDINTQLPLSDIGLYFSAPLRQWIAACAVYPELNWELTLALGKELSPPGLNLCQAEAISQLLRLDWFRKGHIPAPVRLALMKEWIDPKTLASVHAYVASLMRQDLRYESLSQFPAYRMQMTLHELLATTDPDEQQRLAEQLKADLDAGHHPPDMVSLHYMNQQDISPLFFVLPDEIVGYLEEALGQSMTNKGSGHPPPPPQDNFILVKGGTFDMGDVMGDKESSDETVHKVTLNDFYMAPYPVTFAEYDRFCEATGRDKPSDSGWGRGSRPVINVSWYDVVEYCNWLSGQQGLTAYYTIDKTRKDPNNTNSSDDLKWMVTPSRSANGYRLPTEAEWEYAAREGGKKVRFGNGKDIIDPKDINFDASEDYKKPYSVVGEYRQKTVPVGSLNSPNALGLHDMSGNVWEWCWDWYDSYPTGAQNNPQGADKGPNRVFRGGGWANDPQYCRAAYRFNWYPAYRDYAIGFRLARS